MKLRLSVLSALVLILCQSLAEGAGPSSSSSARLISFDDLQNRLGEADLRLLDVRPKADFDRVHIQGAVWVDAKEVEKFAAKPGSLTDRAAWETWIEPLGIGPETEVVIYEGSRQLDAARLWWLLSYLGVEKVGLVNGNFPLWLSQNRPTSDEATSVSPRPFHVKFRAERHATREDVQGILKGDGKARIVDARTEGEHSGVEKRSKRAGHIPTACHLEWNTLVDKDGRFLDEAALRAKLDAIGIKPGEPLVTHCQGGGRASVDAFVFERLGFTTRNYYLGWSDWGNAEDTPVESGKGSGAKR